MKNEFDKMLNEKVEILIQVIYEWIIHNKFNRSVQCFLKIKQGLIRDI